MLQKCYEKTLLGLNGAVIFTTAATTETCPLVYTQTKFKFKDKIAEITSSVPITVSSE